MNSVYESEANSSKQLDSAYERLLLTPTIKQPKVKHAELKWTIENFSSFPRKNNKYIRSPNFVVMDTAWNLVLHPKAKICGVDKITLNIFRNVSDSGPEAVKASYRLGLQSSDNKVWFMAEEGKKFGKGDGYGFQTSLLGHLKDFMSEGREKNDHSLSVLCEMYVWYTADILIEDIEWHDDANLMDFDYWSDMLNMLHTSRTTDVMIKVPNYGVRAHKCVLCARSKTLSRLLEDGKSFIQLNCAASCMKTALYFMYSGNYSYLAEHCVFAIGLYELAWKLSLSGLKELLIPHKVELKSKIVHHKSGGTAEMKEFRIADILHSKEREYFRCFNRTHEIGVLITFQSTDSNSKEYIDCHYSINGLSTALAFRLDICLLDKNVFPNRIITPTDSKDFGFKISAYNGILTFSVREVSSCLQQHVLYVQFCVRTTKHLANAPDVRAENNDGRYTNYDSMWLNELSSDFKVLYDTGEQSDFTLMARERMFKVHRSILVARSPYFRRSINLHDSNTATREVLDMDPEILALLLTYMYCGRLGHLGGGRKYKALQLYEAAEKFQVEPLIEDCETFLSLSFDPTFVYEVLDVARTNRNQSLVVKCLNYINGRDECDASSEVGGQPKKMIEKEGG